MRIGKITVKILVVSIILLLCVSLGVIAANDIELNVEFDGINDALNISGRVQSERAGIPLLLNITFAGETENMQSIRTTAPVINGWVEFDFGSIGFRPMSPGGTYTIRVSSYLLGVYAEDTFVYASVSDLHAAMQALNVIIAANDRNGLRNTVSIQTNADQFVILSSLFNNLGTTGQNTFLTLMLQRDYTDLPPNIATVENEELTQDIVRRFRADYEELIALAAFADINNLASFNTWKDRYFERYILVHDSANTALEHRLYPYLALVRNNADFGSRLSSLVPLAVQGNWNVIRDAVYEQALLALIRTDNQFRTREILLAFPELFPINMANFNRLSVLQEGSVFADIVGTNFTTRGAVTARIDTLVNQLLQATTSGGGGGGGGGTPQPPPIVRPGDDFTIPPPTPENQNIPNLPPVISAHFVDLAGFGWASDAIDYLASAGILNGVADGWFAPSYNVTRAQFVRMLVLALDIELSDGHSTFADVADDAWFAPYIFAAQSAGIVLGDDVNNANPNGYITRQDMAVLLFRAANFSYSDTDVYFLDSAEISHYAVDAVVSLVERGIILGMGDNTFAPLNNATRAQAAVIIYRLIR